MNLSIKNIILIIWSKPTKCYYLVVIINWWSEMLSENRPFSAWYLCILTPNVSDHISKATFTHKFPSWIVLLVSFTKGKSLKLSTIIWASQIRVMVSLPDNCETNTGWSDWSLSTETSAPGLLSLSFRMYHYLFPFVIHCNILSVTNIHDAQNGISSFRSKIVPWGPQVFLV